jgi:hypothetical protein
MNEGLKGADFIAVVRLTNAKGIVLAAVGKSCEKVPESSLGWLERDGLIRRQEPRHAELRRGKATEGRE